MLAVIYRASTWIAAVVILIAVAVVACGSPAQAQYQVPPFWQGDVQEVCDGRGNMFTHWGQAPYTTVVVRDEPDCNNIARGQAPRPPALP